MQINPKWGELVWICKTSMWILAEMIGYENFYKGSLSNVLSLCLML